MPGKKAPNSENGLGPITKVQNLPPPDVTERQQRESNPQNVEVVEVILLTKNQHFNECIFMILETYTYLYQKI